MKVNLRGPGSLTSFGTPVRPHQSYGYKGNARFQIQLRFPGKSYLLLWEAVSSLASQAMRRRGWGKEWAGHVGEFVMSVVWFSE